MISTKKIKTLLNNFFGFNRQQRSGLLVLCSLCFVLLLVRIFYPAFIKADEIVVENLPLVATDVEQPATEVQRALLPKSGKDKAFKLFAFDPNTVTLNELLNLGLNKKTAHILLKFRQKGFVFKHKKDLKKIYGMSQGQYEELEPYIIIEKKTHFKSVVEPIKKVSSEKMMVELNTADSLTLLEIKGVGPSFAKRILKYKSLLGGFISVEQLKEVYGLTEEIYQQIYPQVKVDAALLKKIDLNRADFKTVNSHPYFTYEITKTIFDTRKKMTITKQNLQEVIYDEALCAKILPYLSF